MLISRRSNKLVRLTRILLETQTTSSPMQQFGKPKNPHQPGKIKLPRQTTFPDYAMLKMVFEQAQVNRGQEVELMWQVPGTYRTYAILCKFDKVTPHPLWNLWEDDGRQSKLVSKFETSDLNLILDVIMMLETQTGPAPGLSTGSFSPFQQGDPRKATGAYQPFPSPNDPMPGPGPGQQSTLQPGGNSAHQFGGQPFAGSGSYQTYQPNPGQSTVVPPGARNSGKQPAFESLNPRRTGSFQSLQTSAVPPSTQAPPPTAYKGTPLFGGHNDDKGSLQPASGMPSGSLPADFFSDDPAVPGSSGKAPATALEGDLKKVKMADVLTNIGMSKVSGMLEVIGDAAIAQIYFVDGTPKHAQAGSARGDGAIKEVVTWRKGEYKFHPKRLTEMVSCEKSLQASIMEGSALLDQLRHLEAAKLTYESQLVLKQKNLSDTELKLMLSKGHPLDFEWQKQIYEMLKKKRTFTDLLRDRPMEMSQWAPLLFNFLYCGIIEIKEPAAARGGALDFLGDVKHAVQSLRYNFIRPETGILTYEALMYFMEYEFYRFEAYNWPLSLILFEMNKRKSDMSFGSEMLPPQAVSTAALRIDLVKRPLDSLGHFESLEYAIILPNTKPSQAAFVANRIFDAITNTPLTPEIDRRSLLLSFGVSGLPSDGDELRSMIDAARAAKNEAREGTFPIVLSRSRKRD